MVQEALRGKIKMKEMIPMPNNLPVLPDWLIGAILVSVFAMAAVMYIMELVNELRRYRIRKKLMKRIAESKRSDKLAAFYAAAALGDEENFEYFYNTAKKFM